MPIQEKLESRKHKRSPPPCIYAAQKHYQKKNPPLFPYFPVYTSDMFTHPYYLLLTTYESQILRHPLMSFACFLIAMMQHYI